MDRRSVTSRWPLIPLLLRSHVWLYSRIIVSKSHWNTSMYVDTVINFAKFLPRYHILHSDILHNMYRMSDHIGSSFLTKFRQATKVSWYHTLWEYTNCKHTTYSVYAFKMAMTSCDLPVMYVCWSQIHKGNPRPRIPLPHQHPSH